MNRELFYSVELRASLTSQLDKLMDRHRILHVMRLEQENKLQLVLPEGFCLGDLLDPTKLRLSEMPLCAFLQRPDLQTLLSQQLGLRVVHGQVQVHVEMKPIPHFYCLDPNGKIVCFTSGQFVAMHQLPAYPGERLDILQEETSFTHRLSPDIAYIHAYAEDIEKETGWLYL